MGRVLESDSEGGTRGMGCTVFEGWENRPVITLSRIGIFQGYHLSLSVSNAAHRGL